ncbi:MAG: DUF4159 domain-containing protein [Anaerolineae bacterium]|nr:DUF4159 domain-containing protein [Anaerolineae bacterium]
MTKKDWLQAFPTRRIKPLDGLAVTAEVWEEEQTYHRQRQRFHAMLEHGPGIVTGLEVIASDPPDTAVYVLPGIAVDPQGQSIVLVEPVTYDVGQSAEGLLYVLLSYGESRPRAAEDAPPDAPRYVHAEYSIEARETWPDTPCVELARVRRQGHGAAIFNAQDTAFPGPNEIDLRFRREIGARPQEAAAMAVSYLGGGRTDVRHGQGASHVARAFNRSEPHTRLHVDHNVPLGPGLTAYTLLYLVGQGSFQLSREEMQALYAFMQGGGTVLIESCRHDTAEGEPPADTYFYNLMGDLGLQLTELRSDQRLLREPNLFAAPPAGFETQGAPKVIVSEEAIFSTYDYGCLWQGERRGRSASREEIRAALEWGANIVAYAVARRRRVRRDAQER